MNAAESQEPALDVNSPEPTEDQAKQASINDKFQLGEGWFAVGDEVAQMSIDILKPGGRTSDRTTVRFG